MVKDKNKEKIMEFISSMINIEYGEETLEYKSHHVPDAKIPKKYRECTIKEFFFLYRLDCLLEKELINSDIKKTLLELYDYYLKLDDKYTVLLMDEIHGVVEDTKEERSKINNKLLEIEKIFANYHLLDDINLGKLFEESAHVDNSDYDLTSEVNKIK